MDVGSVLLDILIVLVAAKLAAELAERAGVPAVVGEILAGVIIGPSVFGLVGAGAEVLRTLGEIGVILLLLEVGLAMDLADLGRVGRASLLVAIVGVVAPMALGFGAMQLIGSDFDTALFVAAALTATSVGITARVFGDLRALASTEARVVLGAAVADDVMGLVVLTVVVRLVTEGSISILGVAGIIALAVAFLVVGGLAGLRAAPPLFAFVAKWSRSTGTMVALALAFTLAYAQLADAARLAPIVGAFVAGIALSRTEQADRVGTELAPVGHLFIPVFFLQIGIDAEVEAFLRADVLLDAAILLVVAAIGKLVSPVGALGMPGDKLLIGLGMLPRGEVGLIFTTIGLQSGVLDDDLYAALLLVVLVTTLVTPQLLKLRYTQLRARAGRVAAVTGDPAPASGYLRVEHDEVVLAATPPAHLGLPLALEAALLISSARPSGRLLDWLSSLTETQLRWDRRAADAFLAVVGRGNARSWRFLDTLGILERAVPELAETLRARHADPFEVDPAETHRWSTVERLRDADDGGLITSELARLKRPQWLMLAALLVEALEDRADRVALARQVVRRLDLGAAAEQEVAALLGDTDLLWSLARRADGLSDENVLQVASHLGRPELARALFVLSLARAGEHDRWEHDRLVELHDLVQQSLAHPELTGLEARNLVGQRRAEAIRWAGGEPHVVARIERAPRSYLLVQDGRTIARQASLLEAPLGGRCARVEVNERPGGGWCIDVASRDRAGLLAAVTGALAESGLDVRHAIVATWPDGMALESFQVVADVRPDPRDLQRATEAAFDAPLKAHPLPEAAVSFDSSASPSYTVCEIKAPDEPGLLHGLATALAAAGVNVHSASVSGREGLAVDRFEVTDRDGHKLGETAEHQILAFITGGVAARARRFRRTTAVVANPELVALPASPNTPG